MVEPPRTLRERIAGLLRSSDRPLLAREIADRLGVDRTTVNRILHGGELMAVQDDSYGWRLPVASAASPLVASTTGSRLGRDPEPVSPLDVPPPAVQWALDALDRWVAAGRRGIAVASTELGAKALLLLAVEDHLSAPGRRVAVATGDQPLLLVRSLRVVSEDVHLSGFGHRLRDGMVTVYALGSDTYRLREEALAAEPDGPLLLALVGCRRVRSRITIRHLGGPYRSRLAIDYPGPLPRSTMDLLAPEFGGPLSDSPVQRDVLTDFSRSGERTAYATARARELAALFGDDWSQPGSDRGTGTS
jgi:hypothetical protein